ncbi:MAG: class I SAM-dependent methyltransferase [Gammaproteobacteria bacterium]
MGASERQQAWTRYWQSGALHSCAGSYDGNYGGAIAAFWHARFADVTASMRVLDLCTGNGPLPALLLARFDGQPAPRIDAVDFAEPRPAWANADRITFHARTSIESLPFEDAAFDRVYSQFGFEYADTTRALAEALRVLSPNGELALVCHHAGSWLAEVAAEEVAHLEWLTANDAPDIAAAVAPAAARGGIPAAMADTAFDALMRALAARARVARLPDALHDAGNALGGLVELAAARGESAACAAAESWRTAIKDARLRSSELVEHALDADAVNALATMLRGGGRGCEVGELREGDYLVGWTVVSR